MVLRTVLIADDDEALAAAIAGGCRELQIDVITCRDGRGAFEAIVRQPPDLLILDMNLPGADNLYVYEQLACDRNLAPVSTILLIATEDEATVRRCNSLGVHYVCKSPDTWRDLKPIALRLLDIETERDDGPEDRSDGPDGCAARSASPRVLVVDDDPDIAKAIKIRLHSCGVEVISALNGMQGFWAALKAEPDVIITDYRMPEGHGDYLLGRLQQHSLTRSIPVIVLTGQSNGLSLDHALERDMMNLGAVAFLSKPLDTAALLKELHRHIRFSEGGAANLHVAGVAR